MKLVEQTKTVLKNLQTKTLRALGVPTQEECQALLLHLNDIRNVVAKLEDDMCSVSILEKDMEITNDRIDSLNVDVELLSKRVSDVFLLIGCGFAVCAVLFILDLVSDLM